MKKATLQTVLFLFLLVPASITRAQKVSVSGNVYEKGTVKNKLTTPYGAITAILPDDMLPGDQISGTVIYEPVGKRERDKNKNRIELLKYRLSIETRPAKGTVGVTLPDPVKAVGFQTRPQETAPNGTEAMQDVFVTEFKIPVNYSGYDFHLVFRDAQKNIVAESSSPVLDITIPDISAYAARGRYWGDSSEKKTQVPSSGLFTPDKKIYLAGEPAQLIMRPLTSNENITSARMIFLNYRKTGEERVYQQVELKPVTVSPRNTVITIPKNIFGPSDIIIKDENNQVIATEKIHVLQLEASCPKTNLMKGESTTLTVQVKGISDCPAEYLRLSLDNTTSSVQLGNSNHEELFIEPSSLTFSALNRDGVYAANLEGSEIRDKSWGQSAGAIFSVQRPIMALQSGNFNIDITLNYPSSVYNDPFRQHLDVLKTVSQFNKWVGALRLDWTGVTGVEMEIPYTDKHLDAAKLKAYNYARWLNVPTGSGQMPQPFLLSTLEAGKAAAENAINEKGTAPIQYEVINSALLQAGEQARLLNNIDWQNIMDSLRNELLELQRRMQNLSLALRTMEDILKAFEEVQKWITRNMRASADPESHIDFINAQIREISFPKMDAADKGTAAIAVYFNPKELTVDKTVDNSATALGKTWPVSNFTFEMDGLPCKGITKIEAFKLNAKIPKSKFPGTQYPYIEFKIPYGIEQPWHDWIKNKSPRNGTFQYIDEKSGAFTTIELKNVRPVSAIKEPGYGTLFKIITEETNLNFSEEVLSSLISTVDPGRVLRPNDLVAVFNPQSKKLVYDPQYKEQVFAKMQPRLRPDGKYDVQVMSVSRKPVSMVIDFIPGSLFDLIKQSQDSIKYDKYGFESTGEMIQEHWDSDGVGYRFYKNAQCKRWKEAGESGCSAYIVQDSTGKYVESGKFIKLVYSSLGHCYEGTEFCTEMYVIDMVAYVYDDLNCKRLIRVKSYNAWSCE